MKSILKLALSLAGASLLSASAFAQGVVSQYGRLQVSGNKVNSSITNKPVALAGNSFFWSNFDDVGGKFYTKEVVDHLVDNWDSAIVRAAMGVDKEDYGAILHPAGNKQAEYNKVKTVVDAAIAKGIYVIIDFHSHHAERPDATREALEFFKEMSETYGDKPNVIYEIFNEPIRQSWSQVKTYAELVIAEIRKSDPDNLIIVGSPTWSQDVDIASNDPITDSNLAYTLHFYAATHKQELRNKAATALRNGIPLFVTEWGTVNAEAQGSVDVAETKIWLDFMKQNNISHVNWSISDKGINDKGILETASVVSEKKGVNGLLSNDLTESGNFIKCIIEKWNSNTDFSTCNAGTGSVNPGTGNPPVVDNGSFPKGAGTKISVSESNWQSPGVQQETINGSLVFKGLKAGESASFSVPEFDPSKSYTIQVVLSSTSLGHTIELQRDSGKETLGSKAVPNTGGLENYQIVTITGVKFSSAKDMAIAVGGTGSDTLNVESFYYTLDNDPSLSIEGFDPIFDNANLYPNPAKNQVTIDFNQKASFKVLDITGRVAIPESEFTGTVNTSSLASGFYLLQLNVEGKIRTYKFVKE